MQNYVSNKSCKSLFRLLLTDEYRLSNNRVRNIDRNNRVSRRIFGCDGEGVAGESNVMKSFIIYSLPLCAVIRIVRGTERVACIGNV